MYENYTYEYILNSILDRISSIDSSIDTREGSAIWYAVSPVAIELAIAYSNCDILRKESFVGTASREGIYRACEDLGMDTTQFEPSAGVFEAYFQDPVNIGSRWWCGGYNFRVDEELLPIEVEGVKRFAYRLVCETLGSHTAHVRGKLTPITEYGGTPGRNYVAVITDCIIVGADETPDEKVRAAYFEYVANKAEDGNIAQYHKWLNEYPGNGVGAQKIIPAWNGANTVKAVILDENKQAPTPEFIAEVQEYLDPNSEGLGEGKAPIGAVVTVVGGINAYISVKADITLVEEGANITDINEKLTAYFEEIAFKKTTVNIYEVASKILSSPSVSNVDNIQLGRWIDDATEVVYSSSNITLEDFETPVLHEFIKA